MSIKNFFIGRAFGFILVLLLIVIYFIFFKADLKTNQNNNTNQVELKTSLTEAEARTIAESTCIKGGESLAPGTYNAGTKTWWFDANLNAIKEGCNPACVVSESSKSAEINWRCTGLIVPKDSALDIKKLFILKYPKYAETLTINIEQETENHARGSVSFASNEAGGIFLATKIDGVWQLVFDGNGAIPCSLNKYGFPKEMLSDCAQ